MKFRRYQHVERFGNDEVEDINIGTCYIFPKIDGTNSSVYLGDDGEIKAGSRNRELTLEKDNAGFYKYILEQDNIRKYLEKHPTHRLYGEFLVPHSLKTYRDDAWRKFYVFDVCLDKDDESDRVGLEYIPYNIYQPMLEEFGIEYLAPLRIINNPTYDDLIYCTTINDFLIKDGEGQGEGIVSKNYDYYNKYGRQTWAKIVTSEFKEKHYKEMGAPEVSRSMVEEEIVEEFITEALVEKEFSKIKLEENGWSSKLIPRLLETVFYELVNEEMWHILKKFKSPKVDFKVLRSFSIKRVKLLKPEIFC